MTDPTITGKDFEEAEAEILAERARQENRERDIDKLLEEAKSRREPRRDS